MEHRSDDVHPMESIGSALRSAREKLNISLKTVAHETRISLRHLENIDADRFGDLPGGMYNRAFLKAYCDYLGLPHQKYLQQYLESTSRQIEKTAKPAARTDMKAVRQTRGIGPVISWSVLLVVSIGGIYLSRDGISRLFSPYFSRPRADSISIPPDTSADLQGSQNPESSTVPPPAESVPPDQTDPPTETGQNESDEPLRMDLEVVEQCWVSVTSDGTRVMVKIMEPGDEQTFRAEERFYVILGNAGGVRIRLNGKPARALGASGEVTRVLITLQNLEDLLMTDTAP